ncbi:hypothetical protein FBEOM_7654 [Fusarium beomiforme]|uniref:Uncharacterized protein n=1 Tax=Fusarium beomiforme TaxID=44412 RepID=A0A9P5AHI2_9HYPO|nr:hypothetical protein FBEOM_7654 [Fusarium beomiforme]
MEDDSQPLDLAQWDYNDLDFRTPQLSGIESRGVSLASSPLFRVGKKLRIDISFICKEELQGSRVVQQQGGGGRGSATARQLAQRDQLLETQEAAGQPRVWKDVYPAII